MIALALKNYKEIFIGLLLLAVYLFYSELQSEKADNKRLATNLKQIQNQNASNLTLTRAEFDDFLQNNKVIAEQIKSLKIKENRIEKVTHVKTVYRDTTRYKKELDSLLSAIASNKDLSEQIIDTTGCVKVKGEIAYKNGKLNIEIKEKSYSDEATQVMYWQRREWKFLGIKTRFLGKKEYDAKTTSTCGGEIKITNIDIQRKR